MSPETTRADWLAAFNVNLVGSVVLMQAARPHLAKVKGAIVNFGSISSRVAQTGRWVYTVCKAAILQLTRNQAMDLAPDGIRVNAIAPGAVPGGGFDADTASLSKMIPLGRTGTPEDIAEMAVALLCDRFSRYVTGTTVVVDGGLSLYNWIPAQS